MYIDKEKLEKVKEFIKDNKVDLMRLIPRTIYLSAEEVMDIERARRTRLVNDYKKAQADYEKWRKKNET